MNCEWAEEHLSAFLDDALDSQSHSDLEQHLAGCSHCRAILDDYRRNDRLLATLPRFGPPDTLRTRIFDSPEYHALLEELRNPDDFAGAPSLAAYAAHGPDAPDAAAPDVRYWQRDERDDGPRSGTISPRSGTIGQRRGSLRRWARVGLPAAAAVMMAIGGGYVALHSSGTNAQSVVKTVGGQHQSGIPFPVGPRVVYERGGILWSAPQPGTAPAHNLSSKNGHVAGWAVSPLAGASNGRYVAYIDAQTGALHVIRSDGQNDQIVGHVSATSLDSSFWSGATGQAISQSIAWAPDGLRLAYLATDGSGNLTLHVVHFDGTHAQTVSGATMTSSVREIAWLAGAGDPTLTWATSDGSSITGVYTVDVASGAVRQLSPANTHLTAAAFNTVTNTWLAADGTTLYTVSASAAGGAQQWTVAGSAPAGVTGIVWAPKGTSAALVGHGEIALWSATAGVFAHQASNAAAPGWSPDGTRLAYLSGDSVIVADAGSSGLTTGATIQAPGAESVAWAPDAKSLAIVDTAGVLVVSANGSAHTLLDSQAPDSGTIEWSVVR